MPGVSTAESTPDSIVRRLFVTDRLSRCNFLVDTGADVSVFPVTHNNSRSKSKLTLCAANGTPIATFGQKLLQLDFGLRRSFQWPFYLAEVSKPILGTDFLSHFNLLVNLRRRTLIDGNTSLKISGQLNSFSVLQVSYLKFDTVYSDLLNEFPELTRSSIAPKSAHHEVSHAIITQGQLLGPVVSHPRS
ncbi:uncharacterized protein LOC120359581 [Solenopsis invicta]|uniref:uncharacterized protein LOC120359581 n=1 Tax=Solenopsis invicta TaxID=13686 RepID=UPI00193E7DA8|nr:uncharacterized protein LOC120359581 [Solenopsis invicta]